MIIERLTALLEEACDIADKKCAKVLHKAAVKEAPKDTGTLRRSIYSVVDSNNHYAAVQSDVEYDIFVRKGTGKYNVDSPSNKSWVYKDRNGDYHYTEGQKPNPYDDRAYNLVKDEMNDIVNEEIRKAISKL